MDSFQPTNFVQVVILATGFYVYNMKGLPLFKYHKGKWTRFYTQMATINQKIAIRGIVECVNNTYVIAFKNSRLFLFNDGTGKTGNPIDGLSNVFLVNGGKLFLDNGIFYFCPYKF